MCVRRDVVLANLFSIVGVPNANKDYQTLDEIFKNNGHSNTKIFYLPIDTVVVVELDAQLPLGAALVKGAALRARIAQVDRG